MVDNLIRPANVTNPKLLSALEVLNEISFCQVTWRASLIVKQSCNTNGRTSISPWLAKMPNFRPHLG